jgi:coenzyme F420-0:L-glutamate ligase / coenzyme F420-1:gamma-L-glutamate ligase
MDLHDFLRSRRSVRRFKTYPVPESIIRNILTTATYAPSAHNRQPWRFVVVTSQDVKSNMADALAKDFRHDLDKDNIPEEEILARLQKSRSRIISSPVIVILCMDFSEMDEYPDSRRSESEKIMAVQSTANAGMQLLLAIHAEGLGCVWTCAPLFTPDTIRAVFNLPSTWEPQAMYFIGYPDETPRLRERKSIQEISIFL